MKRLLALVLTVSMLLSLVTIPATATETNSVVTNSQQPTTLINMDFEDKPTVNILTQLTDADVNGTNGQYASVSPSASNVPGVGVKTRILSTLNNVGELTSNAALEVIDTNIPDGRTGKVLKYYNNSGPGTSTSRNFVVGFIAPTTTNAADLNIAGSVLVVEYDIYLESAKKTGESEIPLPTVKTFDGLLYNGQNMARIWWSDKADNTSTSLIVNTIKNMSGVTKETTVQTSGWTKIRVVADLTDTTNDFDSYRLYIGDTLVQVPKGTEMLTDLIPAPQRTSEKTLLSPFAGLSFGGFGSGDSTGAVYLDNIKVTKVPYDFKVTYDSAALSDFDQNEDTAVLSFTTEVDENTVDEIYLVDNQGAKVENGLTATVDTSDATKVNVTLDAVAIGTYNIVLPVKFTDIYGQGIGTYGAETKLVPVTVTTEPAQEPPEQPPVQTTTPTVLIDMDFDDKPTGNVLSQITDDMVKTYDKYGSILPSASSIPGIGVKTRILSPLNNAAELTSNAALEVIDTNIPDGRTGKVLKYYNNSGTNEARNFVVGLIGPTTTNAQDLNIAGSVLVVEYDIYLEPGAKSGESEIPLPTAEPLESLVYNGQNMARIWWSSADGNTSIEVNATKNMASTSVPRVETDGWTKIKLIADLTDTTNDFDTYRLYIGDTLVQVNKGTETYTDLIPGPTRDNVTAKKTLLSPFAGLSFGGFGLGYSTGAVYIDNIKVQKANKLGTHIDASTTAADPTDPINLTFSNDLSAASIEALNEAVKITDTNGKEVAIEVTTVSDSAIKITPESELRYDTEYTVTFVNEDESIVDALGQVLPEVNYTFRTAKSHDAAIDTDAGTISYTGNITEATNISYTMKLTENAPTECIGVVAIYSANGTLIALQSQVIAQGTDTASFNLSAPEGGTELVKMYLYERTSGSVFAQMKQRPDKIAAE